MFVCKTGISIFISQFDVKLGEKADQLLSSAFLVCIKYMKETSLNLSVFIYISW